MKNDQQFVVVSQKVQIELYCRPFFTLMSASFLGPYFFLVLLMGVPKSGAMMYKFYYFLSSLLRRYDVTRHRHACIPHPI